MSLLSPCTVTVLLLASALSACGTRQGLGQTPNTSKQELQEARDSFNARCKNAGVTVNRVVHDVDGLLLLKLRPTDYSPYRQDATDPYGYDFDWDGHEMPHPYIGTFLEWSGVDTPFVESFAVTKPGLKPGYRYVEVTDPMDGLRHRYTGRYEEPWQYDKHFLKGYVRFVVDKAPAGEVPPKYGVTYEDITTPADRRHWIAGSSLKVIDLSTNEVIAERIGYMIDFLQGATPGGRQPWTFARTRPGWSCPQLTGNHQTRQFVEQVLLRPEHDSSVPTLARPTSQSHDTK